MRDPSWEVATPCPTCPSPWRTLLKYQADRHWWTVEVQHKGQYARNMVSAELLHHAAADPVTVLEECTRRCAAMVAEKALCLEKAVPAPAPATHFGSGRIWAIPEEYARTMAAEHHAYPQRWVTGIDPA